MRSTDYLTFYAEHFHTIEVDSTFYGCPTARTANNWGARTPEGFLFSAKVPQIITHEKVLVILSVVRLYAFDEFLSTRIHSVYSSALEGRCITLGGLIDRKHRGPIGNASARLDQLPCEMVQCAFDVMNGVSSHQGNGIGNRISASDVQCRMFDLGYRVRLGSNRVWLALSECTDRGIQVTDGLVPPYSVIAGESIRFRKRRMITTESTIDPNEAIRSVIAIGIFNA